MPGPNGGPDANPNRTVPGVDPDRVLPPRPIGRTLGEVVYLDSGNRRIRGGALGFRLPMAGPCRIRSDEHHHPSACVRVDLGPAKDDHAALDRSAAVRQPGNDALADAPDDRVFFVHPAQRSGSILDYVQRDRYSHPIFRYRRLGAVIPAFPQVRAGSGAGCGSPAIPRCVTGGDGRRWKRS